MTTAEVCAAINAKPTAVRKFLDRHKIDRVKGTLGSGAAKQIDALALVKALQEHDRKQEAETLKEWLVRHGRIEHT